MVYDFKLKSMLVALPVSTALALSGCGGGGGGSTAATTPAAGGTSISLSPVKGRFSGTCNVSVASTANPGTPIFGPTPTAIAADGTVSVTLPAGSTGPYVVSLLGDGSGQCKYFNDSATNPQNVPLNQGQSLNALVPGNQISSGAKIAITALTESAYQAASAANGGNVNGLTDNDPKITQGIIAALNSAGVSSVPVTSFFAPPTVIPASGVQANDDLGRALVKIARQNSGGDEIAAIRANALLAAAALLQQNNAASATALTNLANNLAASFVPETGAESFASHVQATQGAAASAVANSAGVTSFTNDLTSGSGLRKVAFGWTMPIGNSTTSVAAHGMVIKATLSNAVYAVTRTLSKLINGSWTTATAASQYALGATGWVDQKTNAISFSLNSDGTARVTQDGFGTYPAIFTRMDLNGVPFASAVSGNFANNNGAFNGMQSFTAIGPNGQEILNASGVPAASGNTVSLSGTFGPGAYAYNSMPTASATASQDIYVMSTKPSINMGYDFNTVYDTSNNVLSAMPASGPFCMGGFFLQPATGGTYNVYGILMNGMQPLATPANPCPALPNGFQPQGTVSIAQQTLNGGVSVWLITRLSGSPGMTPNNQFIAVGPDDGKLHIGMKTPAGAPLSFMGGGNVAVNATAATAIGTALGLPNL
ncbi:MAG: hypothetical protein K2P57_06330 [Burkholderiales bacterium]|nr:hypothetical protein [Burkholderiales bacterium]